MRVRRIAAAVVVGALMGAPGTAYAANGNYTPDDPSAPTLAGSVLTCACQSDERYIDYRVQVTAADGHEITGEAVLALEVGTRTLSVPLGDLQDGSVAGRIAWPGDPGAVDPVVDATVSIPDAGIAPLAVPLAVPECASAIAAGSSLPATGLAGWVAPLGAVGALLVALGVALGLVRRSRTR
jgi:hypothetical protein